MLCVYITNKEELLAFFKIKEFPHRAENETCLSKKQNYHLNICKLLQWKLKYLKQSCYGNAAVLSFTKMAKIFQLH